MAKKKPESRIWKPHSKRSLRDSLLELNPAERAAVLASLSNEEQDALHYDWEFWARENQLEPPGDWDNWLILAGRGFGKTRTGAEVVRQRIGSGRAGRIALVAETAADARDVMVEGESGILETSPDWFRPKYEPSKRRLTWPNGAVATTFAGEAPGQLRGPQFDFAWCDELAKWRYARESWDNLQFALRLGDTPQTIITTTPRPIPLIKELAADDHTVTKGGSSYDNIANLSPRFIKRILRRYEGTRLGRQEIDAQILGDAPGALWTRDLIEECRVQRAPELMKIVVGVDPMSGAPVKDGDDDERGLAFGRATGILVVGLGVDGQAYVLEDDTISATPGGWGDQVVSSYSKAKANQVVAEINQGGEMVIFVVGAAAQKARMVVPVRRVHAAVGKQARAEPVAALYEQHRIHHVGAFPLLEDEMCNWVPGKSSPNRIDALVWACWDLLIEPEHLGYGDDDEDDEPEWNFSISPV